MDMIEDDNVDAGRQEIVEYGSPAPVRSIPPQWRGASAKGGIFPVVGQG